MGSSEQQRRRSRTQRPLVEPVSEQHGVQQPASAPSPRAPHASPRQSTQHAAVLAIQGSSRMAAQRAALAKIQLPSAASSAGTLARGGQPAEPKSGIGVKSGLSMDRVRVAASSAMPAQLKPYRLPEDKRGADARTILQAFNDSWFEAKQKLVYEYDSNHAAEGLELMGRLLRYRTTVVDGLLASVLMEMGKARGIGLTGPEKTGQGYKLQDSGDPERRIEANAPGSTDVTSDYDVTFSIPGAPELEVEAVKSFNRKFMETWRIPSAVMFDTNVYTSGFMSDEARRSYAADLKPGLSEATEKRRERIQLALSLLPISQHIARMDKAAWLAFKAATIADAAHYLQDAGRMPEDANRVMADVSEIFAETERLFGQTEPTLTEGKRKRDKIERVMGEETPGLIAEVNDLNLRYEKQLDEVKAILTKRYAILEKKAHAWERELAQNLIDFDLAQGKALVYAQEAYFSAGPAIHVVQGMQGGGRVVLTPNQKLQSILMNVGYKLQHFEHLRGEKGEHREEQAKLGTAKYGHRIGHETVWLQEGNELRTVAAVQDLLAHEKRLVDLKKDKQKPQAEKVAEAHEIEPPRLAMDKFVSIAVETITPYLIAHYHRQVQ